MISRCGVQREGSPSLPTPPVSAPSARASICETVKRGWCLKKGKTDKPWAKAHHSHRYFVSRGNALCYFERAVEGTDGQTLLGLIDLRELVRVRPSVDPTAPAQAIDLVLRSRTYVIVPQPATFEERCKWVCSWAPFVRPRTLRTFRGQ